MACYLPKYAILTPQIIDGKLTKRLQFYSREYIENNNLWDKKLISIIPCGKCIGCRLDKAQDWATRSLIEAKQWKNNCFITLTYNDKNLPKNGSLYKRDMTLFWKNLRYYHKGAESRIYKGREEYPIRYFSCGEYGGEKGRPHYQLIS